MMFGATPGALAADGTGKVSTGACGGLISTALSCPTGCSTLAGTYPRPGPGAFFGVAPGGVVAASAGRVTAICTVVVRR